MPVFTIRSTTNRQPYPGADIQIRPAAGDACTLDDIYIAVRSSGDAGAPFRPIIEAGIVFVQATNTGSSPYAALQATLAAICTP